MNENEFETWAIVELLGRNQIAGFLSEQLIGGQPFIRVDVPEVNGMDGFTKFYNAAKAVYAVTPCSEEVARRAVQRLAIGYRKSTVNCLHRQLIRKGIGRGGDAQNKT